MALPSYNGEAASASASGVSTSTLTITLTANVVGNLLVCGVETNSPSLLTVTDSRGNTWAVTTTFVNTNRLTMLVGRMDSLLKAGDVITITTNGNVTRWAAVVLDYSNAHLTGTAVDQFTINFGTSTSPSSGATSATTVADEIIVGFTVFNDPNTANWTVGAGYTQRGTMKSDGTASLILEDKTVSATGTQTSTATLSGSAAWAQGTLCIRGSAAWYVDYAKADNTGAGTSFAVAKKDLASITPKSGDVIHMAKAGDPAALTGTMTFTDNSTSVATSADLTATLAAKDIIGPYTGSGLLTGDGWWEIASLTASTITLTNAYCGTTRTTVTGYRYNGFDAGSPTTAASIIANAVVDGSEASPIQIIGGYDTSNDTRTGITHFRTTSAAKAGRGNFTNQWISVSFVGFSRCNIGFSTSGVGFTTTSCFTTGSDNNSWNLSGLRGLIDTCYSWKGGGAASFSFLNSGSGSTTRNSVIQGALSSVGLQLAIETVADTCTVRRVAGNGISFTTGRSSMVRNCTVNNCTASGIALTAASVGASTITGCTLSSNTTADITATTAAVGESVYIFNCAVSSTTSYSRSSGAYFYVDRHNQTAGSSRTLTDDGLILTNTAQARADTCLEIQPSAAVGSIYCEWAAPIPVDATGTRTVTVYMKISSTWNGRNIRAGLRINGYWIGANDGVWPAGILSSGYVQYTYTYAMTEIGAIEFAVQVDGTAGSLYIDDLAWT